MAEEHPVQALPLLTALPFDPNLSMYDAPAYRGHSAQPWEFAGWREEVLSWRTSVGLGAFLNWTPVSYLQGPGVLEFLSHACVNSFAKFPIGSAKHAIMCNDDGNVMIHGMLLRTGEDQVYVMWLSPWMDYLFDRDGGDYDVELVHLPSPFLFQIAGANSLETLEVATGDNLHDIGFMRHRLSSIDGHDVRILRIGMAGGLAYEVHGEAEAAHAVYNSIRNAGKEWGIHRVGFQAYTLNHTEAGFPQSGMHFPTPWSEDKDFEGYLLTTGLEGFAEPIVARGSAGPELGKRYSNPIELGWSHMVKFDHDFIGREALERIAAGSPRVMVTLEWNKEDILDVHASQLEPGEPYLAMDLPNHYSFWPTPGKGGEGEDQSPGQWGDEVKDASGEVVGLSVGRAYSVLFHQMLSLAMIDVAHSDEGTELTVIWGEPGTRQKEIRVRVARFPYLNENRNEDVDVSTIPVRGQAAQV
ncbi:MAG TPA: hypothetical protein VNT53_08130 [Pseudolysinimonas sp.]|nr:hypothetical protein [Pseudolysinimonas sp.]